MVEQGLQVRFNADGLYVEEYKKNGKLIAQGKKVGRMFTLDVNIPEVNAIMFAHGSGVVANIEILHKRIGHANVQRLKTMQSRELVTGLSVFKVADMQKVCEACQFEKQAKASFLHDKHVSRNVLELVHSDVWGPAKAASMDGCKFYVSFIDDHTRKSIFAILSGLQGSHSASAVDKPWSGRLRERESLASSTNVSRKEKENVDDVPQIPNLSAGFDDGNSSDFEHSLDDEFGIPSVRTPGVKKALQGMHES
ncbi:hypothetical protein L7F22_038416 [Adiantum nelumboides]|nr:hypothetical protein [Adiantum nelumboides]